MKVDMFVS